MSGDSKPMPLEDWEIELLEAGGSAWREIEGSDYAQIFGREPEAWRDPLGALRLTLAGEPVDIPRARHEIEVLVLVLNVAGVS